jgi:hypothetical protein
VGAETGFVHGQWLQYLEGQVKSLEEELACTAEWIDLETGGRGMQTRSPLQGCGWCHGGTSLSRST